MEEPVAKNLVLMRSIETSTEAHGLLLPQDWAQADRVARDRSPWAAGQSGTPAAIESYLSLRAAQVATLLASRQPTLAPLVAPVPWLTAVPWLLPAAAFLAGLVIDRIADPHMVDLLSLPLLGMLLWNIAVYIAMLLWSAWRRVRPARPGTAWLQRVWQSARMPASAASTAPALAAALGEFGRQWAAASAPLAAARVARTLHASAALFAAGAIVSLYMRGLLARYSVGWESTFLDTGAVATLLSAVFAPASAVFHLPAFSLNDIEALRRSGGAMLEPAAAGARWVHLYAATVLLLVVLPRSVLALWAGLTAQRLRRHFPLVLAQPYFQRLTSFMASAPAVLRVYPYSFTLDPPQRAGLQEYAAALLGPNATIAMQPSTAYGDGAAPAMPSASAAQAEPSATAALFSLAATPEPQNHGAFLAQLLARHGSSLVVLIDASGMRQRLAVAGGDAGRLGQRTALWQDFCGHYGASATVVDLLADPSATVTANTKAATAATTPATAATATTATGGGAS